MVRYDSYKDSDVRWIGEIPNHWEFKRMKHIIVYKNGVSFKSEYFSKEEKIPVIRIGEVGDIINFDECVKLPISFLEEYEDFIIKRNDIMIGLTGGTIGKSGRYNYDHPSLLNQRVCLLRNRDTLINGFLYYYVKSEIFIRYIFFNCYGGGQDNIGKDDIINMLFPLPSPAEQIKIVEFLDQKTSIIDNLIQKKLRKIELLKEQRTSIINHTVTKGLNPDVKMKDSGVKWIGEIPERWRFIPLKYFTKKKGGIKTGPFGTQLNTKDYELSGVKVINQKTLINEDYNEGDEYISSEKFETLKEFNVKPNDLIMGTRGSFGRLNRTTFGKCSIVPITIPQCVLHPCLIRIRLLFEEMTNEYFYYYVNQSSLFLENVILNSNSTTIEVIYGITLREIQFVVPPITEQKQIIQYLDKKTTEIDTQIILENKKIDLLKEYRQSLISEVVTGKIDVRKN